MLGHELGLVAQEVLVNSWSVSATALLRKPTAAC